MFARTAVEMRRGPFGGLRRKAHDEIDQAGLGGNEARTLRGIETILYCGAAFSRVPFVEMRRGPFGGLRHSFVIAIETPLFEVEMRRGPFGGLRHVLGGKTANLFVRCGNEARTLRGIETVSSQNGVPVDPVW